MSADAPGPMTADAPDYAALYRPGPAGRLLWRGLLSAAVERLEQRHHLRRRRGQAGHRRLPGARLRAAGARSRPDAPRGCWSRRSAGGASKPTDSISRAGASRTPIPRSGPGSAGATSSTSPRPNGRTISSWPSTSWSTSRRERPLMLANFAAALAPDGVLFTVVPAYGPTPSARSSTRSNTRSGGATRRRASLPEYPARRPRPSASRPSHARRDPLVGGGLPPARLAAAGRHGTDPPRPVRRVVRIPAPVVLPLRQGGPPRRARTARRLRRRLAALPGLSRGFYEWERWGDAWARWTGAEARDVIEVRGRTKLVLKAVCHNPDIAARRWRPEFSVEGGGAATVEFRDSEVREVVLELPRKMFAALDVRVSRTWCPEPDVPEIRRRDLGVGLIYPLRPAVRAPVLTGTGGTRRPRSR